VVVGADVPPADIIAPKDEDVGFAARRLLWLLSLRDLSAVNGIDGGGAASDVPANRILRRLRAPLFDGIPSAILLASFIMKTDNYFTAGFLITHRNPR
jgi:hypothetical protein